MYNQSLKEREKTQKIFEECMTETFPKLINTIRQARVMAQVVEYLPRKYKA
jgi:hypothetical protein